MNSIADAFDDPLDSPSHVVFRDNIDAGYYYFQVLYFLGIASGVNQFHRSRQDVLADYRDFVLRTCPGSQRFLQSHYWEEFFLVVLRQHYRESENGKRYPIRNESRPEKALRTLLMNPMLQQDDLARVLKTTENQLLRMSMLQHAFRELLPTSENSDTPKKPSKR